ncbi:cytochrome P450 [Artomyces pyxidatus]|uniref:Cytochrome P450 n=1 Tax=Artomyces pyxidatus TaxID=48021 RepID=A0ACB8T7I3_9AGAM|nr:cytochrome P450 [Artomyces pyxidatus]
MVLSLLRSALIARRYIRPTLDFFLIPCFGVPIMFSAWLLIFPAIALFIVQRILEFRKTIKDVGSLPGIRVLISPATIISNLMPRIPYITTGQNSAFKKKYGLFVESGWDAFTVISALPRTSAIVVLADPNAIKEVTTHRGLFPKPIDQYIGLMFFGRNIIASEGDEWKRYRKIAAPAFSEKNNTLVWDESVRVMNDMFDNVWKGAPEVTVEHAVEITLPIALFIIGIAGFGRRISWIDELTVPAGHRMTFKDALHVVSSEVIMKLAVPNWASGLTKRTRKIRLAYDELDQYMTEMVQARRSAEKKEDRYDLFNGLMDAADEEGEERSKLSDRELNGNIFIFLLAGHETTAHTLCFCFALLALYPDEQERLYQQISSIMKELGRMPTYEDMSLFTYSMAVFYETLRLVPPVPGIPKVSAEDTSLVVSNPEGQKRTIPIPKGTGIVIHTPGLHYNPRYWEDPHSFKPSRFLGDWPRDAFVPFSQGARACIGRRFFETEGIAIMTMLISQYSIEITDEPQFADETFEERKARVLASKPGVTTTLSAASMQQHYHRGRLELTSAWLLVFSVVALYVVQRILEFRKAIKNVDNFPGDRRLLSPATILANLLPKIPRITGGRGGQLVHKHRHFAESGWDAFTIISAWPRPAVFVQLADPVTIKEVTTHRARFPKPVHQYKVLMFFGRNIVASEGDEWKRYRKIAAPAFSEKNNKLVWDETVRIMNDMFDNIWKGAPEVTVDHAIEITLPIALFVIGVAGFGRRISWMDDLIIPEGHKMTFKDALHIVSSDVGLKLIFPDWAMGLTKRTRKVRIAFEELDQYMNEMVHARRIAEKKEERYDLFSSLIDATEEGEAKLSDRELNGNIFIFLLAGHETTAHTLCFCFALLALYPDEQERLYQQVSSIMKELGRMPTYDEMSLFTYSMAVFYETLRMVPPVTGIPKVSAEDTSLVVSNTEGEKRTIPIPKGTNVVIHTPGLHYNPRYWEDPHSFKPSRFLGDWPRDAFVPFSQGARACIGRRQGLVLLCLCVSVADVACTRFFETEGIAIMTMLISQYRIELKDEPEFAAETFDERKTRLLASKSGLTTTGLQKCTNFQVPQQFHAGSVLSELSRILEVRKAARSIDNFPGDRRLLSPMTILGALLPNIPRINGSPGGPLTHKYRFFAKSGWDAYSIVSAWGRNSAFIQLADPATIKAKSQEVTTYRARFPKPVDEYAILMVFGRNIIASEGEEWKRYRKIAAPAFSEKNNKLVWDETVLIMNDMFDNIWKNAPEVTVDHVIEITLPIALFVIGVAGFGRRISWEDDLAIPEGHKMTFKDALHTVSSNIGVKLIYPAWAMGLTKRLRNVRLAFEELDVCYMRVLFDFMSLTAGPKQRYLNEMVRARRVAEKKEERHDLFSSLIDAAEEGVETLSDRELNGNIFIFLLAGHETTAHTLSFCFALLALYPDEQERLYQQISSVLKELGRMPTYDDMSLFTYSLAVFNETLRMIPPVIGIPKVSAEDTSLVVSNSNGDKRTIPIPKGTIISIHTPGLHYNPRYWEDPHSFKPSRFLGDWPRDAFVPFSQGARACIGRRFFETEGIAIMTMLVSQYRIEIKDEPQFAQETFEERKTRVLAHKPGLTTTPVRVPLTFRKR